jgi:hypothetical protein
MADVGICRKAPRHVIEFERVAKFAEFTFHALR